MNANTAVAVRGEARLGAMVRSATSIFVYWRGAGVTALRILDLSGRPVPELLDAAGARVLPVAPDRSAAYVNGLLPGHLYCVEVGDWDGDRFLSHLGTTPVQTPWQTSAELPAFPAPYHRS